jgi:tetrahydromethanopterin S-methyltransferase subunit G
LGSSITDSLNTKREADQKTIENLKDEKDLYRDINEELEDIERNLDNIRKKKDRAFGKDKLKYI